jgi:cytochrome o ubiquinol oxidase subunit IV
MTTNTVTIDPIRAGGHDHGEPVENTVFGFWIYILSDCILFAVLFATFGVLSHSYAGGPTGRELFDLPYAFAETMFLLVSSVAYGFGMLAMYKGDSRRLLGWLLITFVLGLGFVGMEVNEFSRMFRRVRPGPQWLSLGIFHTGRHPRRPCNPRTVRYPGNDGSSDTEGTDHPGSVAVDAVEPVLALSRYCLDWGFQHRLSDGSHVMEQPTIDTAAGASHGSRKSYVTGFILAVVLTLIPFALVISGAGSHEVAFIGVVAAAIAQILVHLHFFLHLDTSSAQRWNLNAILFTAVIMAIIMVGTLWIMSHLSAEVGGPIPPPAM